MKHIWSILCQNSSIDNETNVLSLFGCIEELKIFSDKKEEKLLFPAEFQIISFWTVEDATKDETITLKVELLNAKKKVLNDFEANYTVKKGFSRFRSRLTIKGLPIDGEGRYVFRVMEKKDAKYITLAELPMDVVFKTKEARQEIVS